MPIFTYRCETCNERFDLLQKHKDPAPDCCPSCSAAGALVRELGASSFHLKGEGWARDNYSSSQAPTSAKKRRG
jgi:putative FmdB family regulatory protein